MKKEKKLALLLSICLLCAAGLVARGASVSSGEKLEEALSQWNLYKRPSFQYNGVRYYYREKSVHPMVISKDIVRLGKLSGENAPSQDKPELLGCSVWALPDNSDALYLKKGGSRYFLFVSAPAWRDWICYDNSFFLYEGHSQAGMDGGLEDRTHLPDTFIPLGTVGFDKADCDRMPHRDLATNDSWIKDHQVYRNPANGDELYVAVPGGYYGADGTAVRYDRYVKTDPKTIVEIPFL